MLIHLLFMNFYVNLSEVIWTYEPKLKQWVNTTTKNSLVVSIPQHLIFKWEVTLYTFKVDHVTSIYNVCLTPLWPPFYVTGYIVSIII